MNNLRKNKIVTGGILLIFIIICFCGCIKTKDYKTLIIEDVTKNENTKESKDTSFEINRIYRYDAGTLDDKNPPSEFCIGWKDNENFLQISISPETKKFTLDEINYKFRFKKNIGTLENEFNYFSISPNGDNIVYSKTAARKEIYIKNLKNGDDKLITDINLQSRNVNNFDNSWSKNGRYLVFSENVYTADNIIISVYDSSNNILKKFILDKKSNNSINSFVISDDGSKMIVQYYDSIKDIYIASLIALNKPEIKNYENNQIASIRFDSASFIESDKIVFTKGTDRSLYIYDIKTKNEVKLEDNVSSFSIYKNSKYIIYEKNTNGNSSDIFVMELDNMSIKTKKLVYKDAKVANMFWSEDGKKVLLQGIKQDKIKEKFNVPQENIANAKKIEYLILEFK